jgi:hypothetical protein
MMKHIKIESTLAKIANVVFETKDFKLAQQTAIEHLTESGIKESDKLKMIDEISKAKNLQRLQIYCANALLKYEGLGVGKPQSNKTESSDDIEV